MNTIFTRKWNAVTDHHDREPVLSSCTFDTYWKNGLENGLRLQSSITT